MTWGCRERGLLKLLFMYSCLFTFFVLVFFSAVRPLGFVCAQSTLGHKWNVASAPLGKRKKLIVLCSLSGLKNHQAHTYSIKKRRTTWRWRLFLHCKEKWCSRAPWHSRLHEIVIGTTFLMSFFSALVFLNWRLLSRLMEVPGTDLNLEFNFTCSRKKNWVHYSVGIWSECLLRKYVCT